MALVLTKEKREKTEGKIGLFVLQMCIRDRLNGEVRVIMESTSVYQYPIALHLKEKGIFISIVNAYKVKKSVSYTHLKEKPILEIGGDSRSRYNNGGDADARVRVAGRWNITDNTSCLLYTSEIDDEFAKSVSQFETIDELKASLKQQMQLQALQPVSYTHL